MYNFQDVVRLSPSKVVPPLINTKSESQVRYLHACILNCCVCIMCCHLVHFRSLCFSDRKEQNVIFGDNQGQLYCLKDSRIHAPSQNQHAEAVRSICTNQHGQLVLSGSEDKTGCSLPFVYNNMIIIIACIQ